MKLLVFFSVWFPISVGLLLFSFSYISKPHPTTAKVAGASTQESVIPDTIWDVKVTPHQLSPTEDVRVIALHKFLTDQHSPLADFAVDLVKEADVWGLDYALLPAVSMQESQGCKRIIKDSHNCWGFGIYGSKVTRFSSYPEAIARVAKTIKESYKKKGYTNATLIEDIWTPSSSGNWSYGVNFYIGKIKDYERISSTP